MCLNQISKNIFVINLKKRTDRLRHIQEVLKKINCNDYEIVEAIDGNTINRSLFINQGALGLVQTYFKIFELIKDKPTEEIILIEDDCVFSENFCENVNHFLNELPNDWNILYFGGNHNISLAPPPSKLTEHVCKVHHTYSAHCVVMKTKVFFELIWGNIFLFVYHHQYLPGTLLPKSLCALQAQYPALVLSFFFSHWCLAANDALAPESFHFAVITGDP